MDVGNAVDRRTFYLTCIYGAWAFMGAVLGVLGGVYLLWPPPPGKKEEWVEAGSLSQLQPKTPEELVFRRIKADGWKVSVEKATAWVVKISEQEVIAFAPQCPHLGCAYHWDHRIAEFVCPCHASTFSVEGQVLAGPAQRPLDRYEVKVDGDRLLLGKLLRSEASGA